MKAHKPSNRRYVFEQFAAVRRYQGNLSFSPDGSEVAYITNISGQFNLWRQPSTGGYPRQLTLFIENTVRGVSWSLGGEKLAFHADYHGDEFHQLYFLDAQGGWPQQLTSAPEVQHFISPESWSPDGKHLAYYANDRERTDMDIVVRDISTGETKRALAGGAYYYFASWSPDGKHLLCAKVLSNTNIDLILVDLASGSHNLLTPKEGEIVYLPRPWTKDGKGFYLISDEDREFKGLAYWELESGKMKWVETPKWDVEDVALSRNGRYLAWAVNENGYSRLKIRDLKTGELLKLPKLPPGAVTGLTFAPNGRRLAFYFTRPVHSADIYTLDLSSGTLRRLTYGMLGGIDEADMVEPELVHFPTFDGRKIPAFLYRPHGVNGKAPAVLSIHGGPEAQERPTYLYSGLYQYWLNRGIGVLAPNIRGSTGYGKSYQLLIHRDWGGGELKDIESAAKYLMSLPWVDPKRLGVFGGSFGGFATLSAVSRLPDYWASAVDIVGPSNLITFVNSVPPTWRRFMDEWVGSPEKDRDLLVERSPVTYVDQIKASLFIIQGAKDPRVVKAESDQIAERLRARGVTVRYDVYEDEGHGFTKRENELKALKDAAEFMEQHLCK